LITTWSWIRAKALPRLPTLMAGPRALPELSSESLVVKGLVPRGLGHAVLAVPIFGRIVTALVPHLAAAGDAFGYV